MTDAAVAPVAPSLPTEPVVPPKSRKRSSVWRENVRIFLANRFAMIGLIFLVLIVLFCFVGPLIYRTNQTATTLINANLPPSAQNPLGTDPEGIDILGRLMLGGQSTIELGLAVAVLSTSFGALWGALAGYVGGFVDTVLMRIVDMMLSIPFLFFAVLLATLLTPSLPLIIAAITIVSWPSTARIVRGDTLSLRTRDYVVAARGVGSRHFPLIQRHIVPNAFGSIVVVGTLTVATSILIFASLSFLGLEVPPPATNWGLIATEGIKHLFDGYWWELWPATIAIVLTVIAINAIGDGMYDVVDQRHKNKGR
jgi:ABC-type dipeptide/oligopeptide/nickel transport system permease subunit